MTSPDADNPKELLAWAENIGLSEQSQAVLGKKLESLKVHSQLVAARISMAEGERGLAIESYSTHLLLLTLDEDRIRCYLTIVAFDDQLRDLQTSLKGLASSRKLKLDEVSEEVFKSLEATDFSHSTLIHEMFCQGTPAILSQPSRLDFKVKVFSGEAQYQEGEDERVNFRELNLFQNVVTDQLVAMLQPARDGIAGRDVFGKLIPAGNKGKKLSIRTGTGIRFEEADGYYFSEASGMVRYEDNTLWLETTYTVKGDVDLEVGNINFVNQVLIQGEVLSDFSVQSGKGVEVEGNVSGAVITAQDDILLHGGILGQGKGRIRTEKSLDARFINDASVEAALDISISKEALNSRLGALGKVQAKDAVIIGGKLVSLGAMRIGTLGSEMGIKTEVYLGEDFRNLNRTEQIRNTLSQLEQVVEHQKSELEEKITFWQMDRAKENREMENLEPLLSRFEEFRDELERYRTTWQEFELLNQEPSAHRSPICWVEETVFPGTVFHCSGEIYKVKKVLKGPVVIQGVINVDGQLSIKVDQE